MMDIDASCTECGTDGCVYMQTKEEGDVYLCRDCFTKVLNGTLKKYE